MMTTSPVRTSPRSTNATVPRSSANCAITIATSRLSVFMEPPIGVSADPKTELPLTWDTSSPRHFVEHVALMAHFSHLLHQNTQVSTLLASRGIDEDAS